jgi:hypothetical protein
VTLQQRLDVYCVKKRKHVLHLQQFFLSKSFSPRNHSFKIMAGLTAHSSTEFILHKKLFNNSQYAVTHLFTVTRRLTTGVPSEKCVV